MARREVIEITCDRCSKVETQSSEDVPKGEGPEFEGSFQGRKVSFKDLCKRCREGIKNYYLRILKEEPDRPEKPDNVAQIDPKASEAPAKKKGLFGG